MPTKKNITQKKSDKKSKSSNPGKKPIVVTTKNQRTLTKNSTPREVTVDTSKLSKNKEFLALMEEAIAGIKIDTDDLDDEMLAAWEDFDEEIRPKLAKKNWALWAAIFSPVILPGIVKGMRSEPTVPQPKVIIKGRQQEVIPPVEPRKIVNYVQEYFKEHGLSLCKSLTETDLARFKDDLKNNWNKGPEAFAEAFKESYPVSKSRLETIYRSERHIAEYSGVMERAKDANHSYKRWETVGDERTCDTCLAMDGEIVPIDEKFSNGQMVPSAHPNCRCSATTYSEEDYNDLPDEYIRQDSAYLQDVADFIKLNTNCKSEEKVGTGPGSCGGSKGNLDTPNKNVTKDNYKRNTKKIAEEIFEWSRISRENWSDDQFEFLREWEQDDFVWQAVNDALYTDNFSDSNTVKNIKKLDQIMKESNIPVDVNVWRAVFKSDMDYRWKKLITPGSLIPIKGFMSTSIGPSFPMAYIKEDFLIGNRKTKESAIMDFTVPKGTNGVYLGYENKSMKELLLDRGYEFIVKSVESPKNVGDPWKIHMELVGKSDNPEFDMINEDIDEEEFSENASYLNEVAEQMKLNYKCTKDSHGEGFGCGGEDKSNASYLSDVAEVMKLNYNCPDSEKTGTGPGSCGADKPGDKPDLYNITDDKNNILSLIKDKSAQLKELKSLDKNISNQMKSLIDKYGNQHTTKKDYISLEKIKRESLTKVVAIESDIKYYKNKLARLPSKEFKSLIYDSNKIINNSSSEVKKDLNFYLIGDFYKEQAILSHFKGNIPNANELAKVLMDDKILNSSIFYSDKTRKTISTYNESQLKDFFKVEANKMITRITNIDSIVNKNILKDDITVYSGISSNIYNKIIEKGIIDIPTLVSTSRSEKVAQKFAEFKLTKDAEFHEVDKSKYPAPEIPTILEMHVKKGSNALSLEDYSDEAFKYKKIVFSDNGSQQEVLIGHGTKWKVIDNKEIEVAGKKSRKIIVEQINDPKFNSSYLSEVTDFIKQNAKCKKGTYDDTNACGPSDEDRSELEHFSLGTPSKQPSIKGPLRLLKVDLPDVPSSDRISGQVKKLISNEPLLQKFTLDIKSSDLREKLSKTESEIAYAIHDGSSITLNKLYFGNEKAFREILNKQEQSGWHPKGCNTPESIVTHEVGHFLMEGMEHKADERLDRINSIITEAARTGELAKISRYADTAFNRGDIAEAQAEIYASVHHTPENKQNAVVKEVARILKDSQKYNSTLTEVPRTDLSEVADFILFNSKCKAGTFDESNKCGPEKENKPKEDTSETITEKDVLKSKAFKNIFREYQKGTEVLGLADTKFLELAKEKGFDGLPKLVSKDVLDNMVTKGSKPLFRGINDSKNVDQFKKGNYFVAKGVQGSGIYFTYNSGTASRYADKGSVIKAIIDPSAKIIEMRPLLQKQTYFIINIDKQLDNAYKKEDNDKVDRLSLLRSLADDPGKFAVMMGYDAIDIPYDINQFILLNRTKILIQDDDKTDDNIFTEQSTTFNPELGGFHTTDYKASSDKLLRVISQDKADNPKVLDAIKDIEQDQLPSQFLVMKMKGIPAKYYAKTDSIGVDKSLSSKEMAVEIRKVLNSMKTNSSYLNEVSNFIKLNYKCEFNGTDNKCGLTSPTTESENKVSNAKSIITNIIKDKRQKLISEGKDPKWAKIEMRTYDGNLLGALINERPSEEYKSIAKQYGIKETSSLDTAWKLVHDISKGDQDAAREQVYEAFSKGGDIQKALELQIEVETQAFKENPRTLYRKGGYHENTIESYTTDPEGANMTWMTDPDNKIGTDFGKHAAEFEKDGWKVLTGVNTFSGYVGEDEVVLINMKDIESGNTKRSYDVAETLSRIESNRIEKEARNKEYKIRTTPIYENKIASEGTAPKIPSNTIPMDQEKALDLINKFRQEKKPYYTNGVSDRLAKEIGFDKPPVIVSNEQANQLVEEGGIELIERQSKESSDKLKFADYFPNTIDEGYQFDANIEKTAEVTLDAKNNPGKYLINTGSDVVFTRAILSPSAKIINKEELKEKSNILIKEWQDKSKLLNDEMWEKLDNVPKEEFKQKFTELDKVYREKGDRFHQSASKLDYPDVAAMVFGYDAIRDGNRIDVINRGALYVQREDIPLSDVETFKEYYSEKGMIDSLNRWIKETEQYQKDPKRKEEAIKSYKESIEESKIKTIALREKLYGKQKQNVAYLQEAATYLILSDAAQKLNANCKAEEKVFIKLNYNCPDSEKVGSGKGSCSNGNISNDIKSPTKILSGIMHDKYRNNKIAKGVLDHVQKSPQLSSLNHDLLFFIDEIKDAKNDFGIDRRIGGTTTLSVDTKTGKLEHVITLNEKSCNTNYFKTVKTGIDKFLTENNEHFTAASLLSNAGTDRNSYIKAIVDHEIGHSKLIDYTMTLTTERPEILNIPDYKGKPQYITHIGVLDRFAAKMADGPHEWQDIIEEVAKDGWKPPTYYSKSQKREMFAECYSIYMANRIELLHPKILEFVRKVDKGASK